MTADEAILRVHAREVFDSRANPTVEVEVQCAGGALGRAIVPSGASTGTHEAVELRDGDPARFGGRGVLQAVHNVRTELAPKLIGIPTTDQERIDRALIEIDGTPDKRRLGANALLGVSLACAHAGAAHRRVPLWHYLAPHASPALPMPMVNMISGGAHAGRNLDLQDFLLVPIGAKSYSEALQMSVTVYRRLAQVLAEHEYENALVGDEGGYGPRLWNNEEAIELLVEAITNAGYAPGEHAAVALDVASTQFFGDGKYRFDATDRSSRTSEEFAFLLQGWVERYPIVSIEDGMAEDDWEGWKRLTNALGKRVQLIGDDLFVTNGQRLQRGIAAGAANAILVKVNQIGTLTEALQVIDLAKAAGYRAIISARSGETEDTTIADLAVATGVGQIKIGGVARGERLAKYNRLLRIEEEMGPSAPFASWRL